MRRRLTGFCGVALAVAVLLLAASPVAANSDPHRAFLPAGPFDLPGGTYCDFTVHMDVLADREYATSTSLPDGSTVLTVTGSLMLAATNVDTSKTVVVNAGGPGTFTFLPDGTTAIGTFLGRALFWAPNLTDYGFPSNVVMTAGPAVVTEEFAGDGSFTFTSFKGHPQLLTDVCGALS